MIEATKTTLNLFDFLDYKDYLSKRGLPSGSYSHSSKNLNSWSRRLGYKSPSSLSMVLSGERFPSEEMIERICADFALSGREKRYFKLLVDLAKAEKKNKDTAKILADIKSSTTEKNSYPIDLKEFSTISDWYYVAIKQLISTKSFIEDEIWIHRRLRKKVTPGQIRAALNNLQELGIVKRNSRGRLEVVKAGLITTNDIPSSAIKQHHMGMLEQAAMALTEQTVDDRQNNSTTMKIDKDKLPEAKKFIFDFIKEFAGKFSTTDENLENIYQLNVQFFELTKEVRD